MLVKEAAMLRRICILPALLLGTMPALAQFSGWNDNKEKLTPQGAPSGGYSSGGAYQQSRPPPPSGSVSCTKSFNAFYGKEIYVDNRASDATCMPPPPRYDNP